MLPYTFKKGIVVKKSDVKFLREIARECGDHLTRKQARHMIAYYGGDVMIAASAMRDALAQELSFYQG